MFTARAPKTWLSLATVAGAAGLLAFAVSAQLSTARAANAEGKKHAARP